MAFDPTSPENASQALADIALGPPFAGWMLQIFISGAILQTAVGFLKPGSGLSRRSKITLASVLLLNMMVCCITFYEITIWGTMQDRSVMDVFSFTTADAIVPIPAALLGAIVQAFYSHRAWLVLSRSTLFVAYISLCITACIAGAIGLVIFSLQDQSNEQVFTKVFIFNEIWLWASALTDVSISAALVLGLYRHKRSLLASTSRRSTETLLEKVMKVAMQTASVTTVFSAGAAVINVITRDDPSLSVFYCLLYPLPAIYTYSYLFCLKNLPIAHPNRQSRLLACPRCRYSMVEADAFVHGSEGQAHPTHFVMPIHTLAHEETTKKLEDGDDPDMIGLSTVLMQPASAVPIHVAPHDE